MLRFINYDIVFQEIPNEVTLALNISNCPNRCEGCHSPYLMEDAGTILNENSLAGLLERYGNAVTCVCFMGGDSSPQDVGQLAAFLQQNYSVKTGWYSGKNNIPDDCSIDCFNYIKLGPYIKRLGGLKSATTNQRFYRVENGNMIDITKNFFSILN
ncbi:MAG: anaerobic ribonucleoside-triphosphate reductase activating protein [Prevotellaceae bacterium]|jgi:anaerobic ribonucleoside-triphosphate reductase activating protein|nr:anaerobic ribonucleoside-triphosphate reductase activating protein [Prevotellaceae bacterium]